MKDNGYSIRAHGAPKTSIAHWVACVFAIGLLFGTSASLLVAQTSNTSTKTDKAGDVAREVVSEQTDAATEPVSLAFLNEGKNPKSLAQLRAMQDHVREVSERVKEATVNINLGVGQGTGVLVSSDGIILTAAHVIERPLKVALITFSDGSQARARTLGVETGKDSGMLKIFDVIDPSESEDGEPTEEVESDEAKEASGENEAEGEPDDETDQPKSEEDGADEKDTDDDPESLLLKNDEQDEEEVDVVAAAFKENDLPFFPYLDLGVSEDLKDGQWVIAVGHPGGLDEKRGMVVRVGRIINQLDAAVRTDCTLVGGDSGGPLVDMDGNLVAIHSRIGSRLHDNLHVPVDVFSDTWDMLIRGYKIGEAGKLGVSISPRSTLVSDLAEGGPAARAGIEVGDIITAIGDEPVADRGDIGSALSDRYPYEKVKVTVKRGSKEVELEVRLGESSRSGSNRRRIR